MVDREVLIESVLQTIPSYCMSIFLLPLSLCDEIQKMMNYFWWDCKNIPRKGIHWMAWKKLTVRKDDGGMGLCDLHAFNVVLFGNRVGT